MIRLSPKVDSDAVVRSLIRETVEFLAKLIVIAIIGGSLVYIGYAIKKGNLPW